MGSTTAPTDETYECSECGATFQTRAELGGHATNDHGGAVNNPSRDGDHPRVPPALSGAGARIVECYRARLQQLPAPGTSWGRAEQDIGAPVFRRALQRDVIRRVGVADDSERRLYELTEAAWGYLEQMGPLALLPCGHRPFRNVPGGEYSCTRDECDAEYSRAEIEAVIEGE